MKNTENLDVEKVILNTVYGISYLYCLYYYFVFFVTCPVKPPFIFYGVGNWNSIFMMRSRIRIGTTVHPIGRDGAVRSRIIWRNRSYKEPYHVSAAGAARNRIKFWWSRIILMEPVLPRAA
jgi:hypothetical protein